MTNDFEAAKYGRYWAVFDRVSRTFDYIGMGKIVTNWKQIEKLYEAKTT